MKKTSIFLTASIFACIAILSACSARQENRHDTDIQLNQGKKWAVDKPMLDFLQNMENDVSTFRGTTLADYQSLAISLKKNIDGLTSNCTMTGQAHDELHKWLLPYIDLAGELEDSKTAEEAAQKLEEIKASFQTFHQYFQ